jgi:tRNA threonylcarbamoyl adenosine modification protein YeaZ
MSSAPAWLLAIDTATNTIVVAAGSADGRVLASDAFEGRYRHSQELLPAIARLMAGAGLRLADLGGIVVGTGPGAFTGLRVGLATAKTLAHELGRPVVGIPTSDALLAGAEPGAVLWLPSGPRDRVRMVAGQLPMIVRGDETARPEGGTPGPAASPPRPPGGASNLDVAVDLEGRASAGALERGRRAVERLPGSLLELGAARLAAGEADDPVRLVPGYASPPRGAIVDGPEGSVAWSRDPR